MKHSVFWYVCVILVSAGVTLAQTLECTLPTETIIEQAQDLCAGIGVGEYCAAAGSVTVDEGTSALEEGTTGELSAIQSLSVENGGLAILKVLADLPEGSQPVTLIAYGNVRLANTTPDVELPLPTIKVTNPGLYVLNLRDQPNRNSQIVGTFDVDRELVADGRSADKNWVHVQTADGAAWISTSIVNLSEGSIDELSVLESHYLYPWQRVSLMSERDCGGLIVQSAEERPARLQVNDVDVLIKEGAMVASAQAGESLQLQVLNGEVRARAVQYSVIGRQSDSVSVSLGGQDGLTPMREPNVTAKYAFSTVAQAPLTLLPPESAICIAGLPDADSQATLFNGPGEPYTAVSSVSPDYTYVVTGQNNAEDGNPWWRLQGRQWVAQSDIETAGMCLAVEEVAKPSLVVLPGTNKSVVHSFLPAGTSVWQASTSEDILSGTCSTPPIAQCSHLVAIVPNENGGISWRGQEPRPYPMSPVAGDTFAFSGRNQLGNANISLGLSLNGEGSWSGTMTTVYDSDPSCTHTFYYTASRVR